MPETRLDFPGWVGERRKRKLKEEENLVGKNSFLCRETASWGREKDSLGGGGRR